MRNYKGFNSVQCSHSVVSDSLWPHESQYTRPPCSSPTSRVYSNSCPSSQWCHPAISSSVVPFCFCPQSLPTSGSFPMSQLFARGSQSIGVSASASVPSNEHPRLISFRMDWLDLLYLRPEILWRVAQCPETRRKGKGWDMPQNLLQLEGGSGFRTVSAKLDSTVLYIFGWFEYVGSLFKMQI